jgi:competence protein ComGF
MGSRWSTRQQISPKRSGVTLIETLIALGLLAGMFLMWHPVMAALSRLAWHDAEALNVAHFEKVVQNLTTDEDIVSVDKDRLVIEKPEKTKTVKSYSGQSGDLLMFTRADGEGYEPVLTDVRKVAWTQYELGVKYTVTMKSGRIYEGVIVDGEKTR